MADQITQGKSGEFYVKDRTVWKSPVYRRTANGHSIGIGFPVCILHDAANDGAAEAIAKGLNIVFADEIEASRRALDAPVGSAEADDYIPRTYRNIETGAWC